MVVPILLVFLALFVPLAILRPFSCSQKVFVLVVIAAHLALMFLLHYRLVYTTGLPIVVDLHVDTQTYYDNTSHFATRSAFSVTIEEARDIARGEHFGYQYVLGTLWTITPRPVLAMRFLKIMLFFTSLSCLARIWRRDYGSRLAMWGFAFMSIVCTPAFYYNYRNLKDGFILALFMFIMALLDTLLRPRKSQLHRMSTGKSIFAWCTVLILLYAISTFRVYAAAIVVVAVIMHSVAATRMEIKGRLCLLLILIVVLLLAFRLGVIANILELGGERIRRGGIAMTLRNFLQAFLSPLPWGTITWQEPCNVMFYSIYWLLLPYALYTLFRHLWSNIDWHLFLYIMVTYVVGVVIGDPPRKRLILYPILVTWVLAHLAYKQWARARQAEYETEAANAMKPEYSGEYIQAV